MPINHKEVIDSNTEMMLWEITESENKLKKGLSLSKEAQKRLSARKSDSHRKGYLAVRQLLNQHGIAPQLHQYEANGAPYLTDGRFISISHTKNIAAVVISNSPIGVDVEYYQKKIIKIAPRFMHQKEIDNTTQENKIYYYTHFWTAKEAIQKVFNRAGIHFAERVFIKPFSSETKIGNGQVNNKNKMFNFKLYFFDFKDYCVTLAKPENVKS